VRGRDAGTPQVSIIKTARPVSAVQEIVPSRIPWLHIPDLRDRSRPLKVGHYGQGL